MKKLTMCFLTMSIVFIGCQNEGLTNPQSVEVQGIKSIEQSLIRFKLDPVVDTKASDASRFINISNPVRNLITKINASLAGQGIMLYKVEFLGVNQEGRTVYFSDKGNKQIPADWVPNDPRNNGFGAAVPYWIDDTQLGTSSGLSEQDTFDAMVNSMANWDSVTCSEGLYIPFLGRPGFDIGLVQFFTGFGGSDLAIAGAIAHAGILPPDFFEFVLGPGAGVGVIGVTFTFTWQDDSGQPTDIDGNGKEDTALSEIYINDNFNFQDAPNAGLEDLFSAGVVDFETIVLHEVGHGLSQGHFGTAFSDRGTGQIHFSPAALMNAGYSAGRRVIEKTDKAGHCSNWASWPYE